MTRCYRIVRFIAGLFILGIGNMASGPEAWAAHPGLVWSRGKTAIKISAAEGSPVFIRPETTCPAEVEALSPLLLRDLPNYANRVSTRSQVRDRSFNPRGFVLVAAQPERGTVTPDPETYPMVPSADAIAANGVIPLFFTTLERQYHQDAASRIQHYHWVFLSQIQGSWHLSSMFSRIGDYPDSTLVSPPRESRQGSIGQAIQLWLRDCNAGAIAPLDPLSEATSGAEQPREDDR